MSRRGAVEPKEGKGVHLAIHKKSAPLVKDPGLRRGPQRHDRLSRRPIPSLWVAGNPVSGLTRKLGRPVVQCYSAKYLMV